MALTRRTSQLRAPELLKPERVGERLRAIREAAGLKPSEIAEMLEVERTYWTRWEKGHRPIPTDMAWRLTRMFEVDLDYILAGETRSLSAKVQRALSATSRRPDEIGD
jgi:transcriptional regulator with XRE-family HTH domain